MSGETEQQVSGWTVDTLKEYLESKITSQDEKVKLALDSADKAVAKAEQAQEKRLDLLNEFRGQSKDEQSKFADKRSVDRLEKGFNKLSGGLLVVAFIGVANLVKLFLT